MASRQSIDSVTPATMIVSMVGYIIGLAGMALLGFGSLCFMKVLIDGILVIIPSVVNGQNPLRTLSAGTSLESVVYHFVFIAVGTILRKVSGYMCDPNTLRTIDGFFYRRTE